MERAKRNRVIRILVLTLLGIGVLAFVVALDEIFAPLLFSLLLAYILNPLVNWIQRFRIARAPAIGLLFLIFYGLLVLTVVLTVPAFYGQLRELYVASVGDEGFEEGDVNVDASDLSVVDPPWDGRIARYRDVNGNGRFDPGYLRKAGVWLEGVFDRLHEKQPEALERAMEAARARLLSVGTGAVDSAVGAVSGIVYSVIGFLTFFVLIPIYLFYFLMGLSAMWERVTEYLPGRHRERVVEIMRKIDVAVSAFFRGRLLIMVLKGLITAVALVILGIPFALVIGVVTGVGSLIPIAGFLLGFIPAVAIAFFDTGSPGTVLLVVVIFLAIEFFENYMLTPWMLKDRVGLHPMTIVVSVFVGGALFGFVGMLLSVPMTSVAKILFLEFVLPEIRTLAAESPE